MNGIDFVKSVKRDPRLRDTRMLIVSYRDREEDRQRGRGADRNTVMKAAIVNDSAMAREALKRIIAGAGHTIAWIANHGQETLDSCISDTRLAALSAPGIKRKL